MKKYNLGALSVKDQEIQDTKEEIIVDLIDRMQKYVADGKRVFSDSKLSKEEKLKALNFYCERFCGLSEFLNVTMRVEVRSESGGMYTQEMYNYFHYWIQVTEIEISGERKCAEWKDMRCMTATKQRLNRAN